MAERASQQKLDDLLRIRDAQAKASAVNFGEAIKASKAAAKAVQGCEDNNRKALSDWLESLSAERPDPALVALRGLWLVQQQHQLQSEELNSSIADQHRNCAQVEYSSALALMAATNKICAQIQTSVAKEQEEFESLRLADAWLWRREK